MRELRFIAIEGVIGAGKTSLTKVLSNRLHAGVVLEEFEENPFLEKFYADPKKYAFHTQIYFLMSRYRKQREIAQIDLFNSRVITDYLFVKDRIFAEVNLSEEEYALYDKIYSILAVDVPRPDLVIYLQAGVAVHGCTVYGPGDGIQKSNRNKWIPAFPGMTELSHDGTVATTRRQRHPVHPIMSSV